MESNFQGIASVLFFAAFPVLILLIGFYLWSVWKFERFIEKEYPDSWQSLGSPNLITHNSISNNLKFIKFLRRKGYEHFGDDVLNKRASLCWNLYKIIAIGFLLVSAILVIAFVVPVVV